MIIVWDEPKRRVNLDKHGIDFADFNEAFFESALIFPAKAGRSIAIGTLNRTVVVIFARLGTEGVSLISARPASGKERRMLS